MLGYGNLVMSRVDLGRMSGLGRDRSSNTSKGSIPLGKPFKQGADQKQKSKKKFGDKSSNMSKVVHMR